MFLVDAGCYLLQQLKPFGRVWEVSGEAIIKHAIQRRSIDMVCVFSPYRHRPIWTVYDSTILWKVTCFDSRNYVAAHEYARLDELAKCLPAPRFEGYQARERHRAGDFDPAARGWYLPTHMMSFNGGAMTIKVSSRLVLEYLAGRLDASQFRQAAFGEEMNIFEADTSSH